MEARLRYHRRGRERRSPAGDACWSRPSPRTRGCWTASPTRRSTSSSARPRLG